MESKLEKIVKIIVVIIAIVSIILFMLICADVIKVKAATIHGDTAIAGFSKLRQMVIDKEGDLPEIEDIKLLAECIYYENWHTDAEKITAYYTGAVVMNRVNSSEFPNSIKAVLYQTKPRQYSTTDMFFTKTIPHDCYVMALDIARNGTPDVPKTILYQARFAQGSGVWKIINGEYFCYE